MAHIAQTGPARKLQLLAERVRFAALTRLKEGGRLLKMRMILERMSGPPGVRRRKGNLQRSLRVTTTAPSADVFRLSAKVGGPRAPYAVLLERWGKLQFGRVAQEEFMRIIADLRRTVARVSAGGV